VSLGLARFLIRVRVRLANYYLTLSLSLPVLRRLRLGLVRSELRGEHLG
jgi:hypothetical protein